MKLTKKILEEMVEKELSEGLWGDLKSMGQKAWDKTTTFASDPFGDKRHYAMMEKE